MQRIISVSRVIRVLLIAAALLQVSLWGYFSFVSQNAQQDMGDEASANMSVGYDFEELKGEADQLLAVDMNAVLWLSTHSLVMQLLVYSFLFMLFSHFSKGEVFTLATVNQIKRIGLCVLLWPLVEMVYPALLLISLKLIGVLEHGEIALGFGSQHMGTMATGVMIMVVGWVMAEASKLKAEQELVI